MKAKKKTERPIRLDFNTQTREIIEIMEISPDGSQVRTSGGWVSSYRENVIVQRPPHVPGFITADQIERAIRAEKEMLREKKYKHTARYLVAQKYPIKEWLSGE